MINGTLDTSNYKSPPLGSANLSQVGDISTRAETAAVSNKSFNEKFDFVKINKMALKTPRVMR